ncbi:MAG: thioredoxin-disulfide reductase [Candidatus Tectomicrobia bacterium]|nr:thioredoxin-disulfide reductase [Candidatus Tectomicrobia bacterium]
MRDIVIIGAGPAGYTAALYTARALLSPLVIAGNEPGGQITLTTDIENYPGFPEAISGIDLAEALRQQAERFGAEVKYDLVTEVDFAVHPFKITTYDGEYEAKSVIITTGSTPRKLEVPGEQELTGHGVSYCATCDGFFFRDKEVVVVGGGDSALDEGLFLTRFASKVHIVHRRDQRRASLILQERVKKNPKIDFIWNTTVTEILGNGEVKEVLLKDLKTGKEHLFPADGVFIYIGHYPNTEIFKGQIALDEHGYILTDRRQRTNVPGVFAGGDVQDAIYRQVATAVGTGCAAAMEAEKFLVELKEKGVVSSIQGYHR